MLVFGTFEKDNPILQQVRSVIARNKMKLDIRQGPWVAGGIVRKIFEYDLSGNTSTNVQQLIGTSDVDIFFDPNHDTKLGYLNPNKKTTPACGVVKKIISLTELVSHGANVQLIEKPLKNVQELFDSFDFTIVAGATNGYEWVADNRMLDDIKRQRLNRISNDSVVKSFRVAKYCAYGFLPSAEVFKESIGLNDFEALGLGLTHGFRILEKEDYL